MGRTLTKTEIVLFMGVAVGVIAYLASRGETPAVAEAQDRTFTADSPTCGPVVGASEKDRDNALAFCAKGGTKGLVIGLIAKESILHVKVPRPVADSMRADRLTAEQLIKGWMAIWKLLSGSKVVSVSVEWMDVEIATGQTSLLSGDRVTIR